MHKLVAPRWTLPTIVILAIITFAIIALILLTTRTYPGNAWVWPV